jgi:hypothetical protein
VHDLHVDVLVVVAVVGGQGSYRALVQQAHRPLTLTVLQGRVVEELAEQRQGQVALGVGAARGDRECTEVDRPVGQGVQ